MSEPVLCSMTTQHYALPSSMLLAAAVPENGGQKAAATLPGLVQCGSYAKSVKSDLNMTQNPHKSLWTPLHCVQLVMVLLLLLSIITST